MAIHIPSEEQAASVNAITVSLVERGEVISTNPNPAHADTIPDPVSIPSMAPKQKDRCKFSAPKMYAMMDLKQAVMQHKLDDFPPTLNPPM
mmetsp:Transcript_8518/g.12537  ORF Transcript_8518/g.12537 Transcript_8518/m.12537 type:complete len:91 (-) Transcript_8518:352-624(-)